MTKKNIIATLSMSSAIALSALTGGLSAKAMATDTQPLGESVQIKEQQQALNYTIEQPKKTSIAQVSMPNTYKVKPGDTLSKIANFYGTTYSKIMQLNNLSSTTIYVGQSLKVSGTASNNSNSNSSNSNSNSNSSNSTSSYTVQSGDTLSKIANFHGTTYSNLMQLNNLSSTIIYVGQSLKVSGTASNNSNSNSSNSNSSSGTITVSNDISNTSSAAKLAVATKAALGQMGVPYVFGAATPGSGFDCSGLIYYALKQAGYDYGRTSAAGYYSLGKTVSSPQYGDLVFFKNTYKSGISHVGFYIGGGQMVSASGDHVQISNVNDSYWSSHFAGFKRL